MERFRSSVVKLSVSVLILTFVSFAILAALRIISNSFSTTMSNPVQTTPDKTLLRNVVKSAFGSNSGKGILAYLDLAFVQEQSPRSYLYIKKAYEKMIASYNSTKAPEKKLALGRLKTYASNLSEYKESDFIIPK